jgi:hypothetical protein
MPPKGDRKLGKKKTSEPRSSGHAPQGAARVPRTPRMRVSAPSRPPSRAPRAPGPSSLSSQPKMRTLPALFPLHSSTTPSSLPTDLAGGEMPLAFTAPVQRKFEFSGSMHHGLTVHLCEPLCYIGIPSSPTATQGSFFTVGSVDDTNIISVYPYTISLNPFRSMFYQFLSNTDWTVGIAFALAPFLSNLAVSFGKFRVKTRLKLHYKPLVNLSDPSFFALAVSSDGAHPTIGLVGTAAFNYPTFASLAAGPQSVEFAAWLPWSVEWDVDGTEKYMYQVPHASADTTSFVFDEPDTRQCSFGSVACLAGSGSTTGIKGMLYWDFSVDLVDPYPLGTPTRPLYLSTLTGGAAKWLEPGSRLEEKKTPEPVHSPPDDDDCEIVAPPKFHATPSTVPGGSLYSPAAKWPLGQPPPAGYSEVPGTPGLAVAPLTRTSQKKSACPVA